MFRCLYCHDTLRVPVDVITVCMCLTYKGRIPGKEYFLPIVYVKLEAVSVQDVEKELEVQIGMKQEMELSMKMLEKDICEKQDALVELRQQLEDLRVINQQLSHKSQVRLHF